VSDDDDDDDRNDGDDGKYDDDYDGGGGDYRSEGDDEYDTNAKNNILALDDYDRNLSYLLDDQFLDALDLHGDEWMAHHIQTKRATLMRAARLTVMNNRIDHVSAEKELQFMLTSKQRNFWLSPDDKPFEELTYIAALRRWIRSFQLRCWDFGDPDTALMLMDSSHLSNQPLILRVLRRVRDRTNKIREVLHSLADDHTRDRYLLLFFLIDSLSGYKRAVAYATIMETRIIHELINQRVILQYLSMLIIPTYNAITLLIVFYASLSISSNTAPIWLITTIISISIYYMWSLPLRVWVLQVWFPHTTKKDIITLHRVLAVRTKSILRRFHGLLFAGTNALLQHFHPACRASRYLPHLPISRLLMSLSDHDLPTQPVLQQPKRRSTYYLLHMERLFFTGNPLIYDLCCSLGNNINQYLRWFHRVVSIGVFAQLRLLLHGFYLLPRRYI